MSMNSYYRLFTGSLKFFYDFSKMTNTSFVCLIIAQSSPVARLNHSRSYRNLSKGKCSRSIEVTVFCCALIRMLPIAYRLTSAFQRNV